MKLKIPESQLPTLNKLLSYSSEKLDQLANSLKGLPLLTPVAQSSEQLAKQSQIEEEEAADILLMLTNLFLLRDRPGGSRKVLLEQLLEAIDKDPNLKKVEISRDSTRRFFEDVFNLDETLGVTAKSWRLARDFHRNFCYARILTDLRPVFAPDSTSPTALMIAHNLRISYHERERIRDLYVALDSKDLQELKEVIERAEAKEKSLRESPSLSIPYVEKQ